MKLFRLPGYLLVAMLLVALACNSDKGTENSTTPEGASPPPLVQDTSRLDSLKRADADSVLPLDSVAAQSPVTKGPAATPPAPTKKETAPKPARQQPQPKPQPRPEVPKEPTNTSQGFQEGTYRLEQVQGEPLPIVLDMTTECDSKLLSGILVMNGGRFRFESNTAEECNGKLGNQEKHEASGDYRLEGTQLFLTIRYGDALGDARGIVEGTTIRLQHIGNSEEQQTVDWLLRRE